MPSAVTEIHAGTFYCPHCERSWIGNFHGEREFISCIFCGKPIGEAAVKTNRQEVK